MHVRAAVWRFKDWELWSGLRHRRGPLREVPGTRRVRDRGWDLLPKGSLIRLGMRLFFADVVCHIHGLAARGESWSKQENGNGLWKRGGDVTMAPGNAGEESKEY